MCNFQILVKNNEKEASCVKKIYKKKQLNSETEEEAPLPTPPWISNSSQHRLLDAINSL